MKPEQRRTATLDELKRDLIKRSQLFNKVFNTPEGRAVLQHLQETYQPSELYSREPHKMHYMAGQRDVVEYVNTLVRVGGKQLGDDNHV